MRRRSRPRGSAPGCWMRSGTSVIAVELFEAGGRLLANEFAPRVHNTAHWTIDGAETSQFENHLRAILGLPLGSTALRAPSVMVTGIGGIRPVEGLLKLPERICTSTARPRAQAGRSVTSPL